MLQSRLCRIRHKIVVMSGKGGVGNSGGWKAVHALRPLRLSCASGRGPFYREDPDPARRRSSGGLHRIIP